MKHNKFLMLLFFVIPLLLISGCSAPPDGEQEVDLEQLVGTYIAQTQGAQQQIEAIVTQTMAAMPTSVEEKAPVEEPSPVASPTLEPTATATATATATETPLPTATATTTVPLAEVSVATNCRTGPGKIYDWVSVLPVGRQVEVVARSVYGTYWVVQNPAGPGTCWLWGNYARVAGETANLPVWDSPPTPTPQAGQTPTPSAVTLRVSVPTNCRVGPGRAFDIVSVLHTGKSVNVIARHATADFWVIENPGGSGNCWVWGEYATFTGSPASLPVWDPPPTPTPASVSLQVRVDTNCRTGPGIPYNIVTVFRIGQTGEVIARNAAGTYWVIKNPTNAGHCWVWGKYATLTGPTASLPVWSPP
jgi:uncharacterized protein YgiM (DUF1202 family)